MGTCYKENRDDTKKQGAMNCSGIHCSIQYTQLFGYYATFQNFAILAQVNMKAIISSSLKFSMLVALVVTFIVAGGITAFTWFAPDTVIELIQTIRPSPTASPMQLKGVAVLGDSQSDEYRADDRRGENFESVTYNWVEILQRERNVSFGDWGTYAEPRRTGYAYNWARSGATARSMIESGQHIGVAEQVRAGEVNVVVMYIGANDYAPFITADGYEAIYNGTLTESQVIEKQNQILADIKTAIDVIQSAGEVKILIVQIPHWSNNFGVSLAFPVPEHRRRVTEAVNKTNEEIKTLADQYAIPTLDPNEFYKKQTQSHNGSIVVGGVKLERLLINNDSRNMFLDDGIHPGTVLNALFANEVMTKLNFHFGTHMLNLTDQEILQIAGINQ